ncbi:hypothetical protein ACFYQA_17220 [Streptomyces sp. NPDC005774]|uniref:hypothetical protein n=1 Tax=Streptomyces sp. NPDC005774 TaxID=3364728 RepID=UPI0036B58B6F
MITAPEQPRLTSQNWAGHWHGFGPWTGSPESYFKEGNRRPAHTIQPASESDHATRYREAAGEFATGSVPPLMSGHWLMKRGQAAHARTWTTARDAVDWLTQRYQSTPPFERSDGLQAYEGLDAKIACALDALPRGGDVSWVHYTQSRGLFSVSVVCCPNLHHPDLVCPLPPS